MSSSSPPQPSPLQSSPLLGTSLVLGSIVSFQLGAAFATSLIPIASPSAVTMMRVCFGAVIVAVAGRSVWPKLRRIPRRAVLLALLYGGTMGAMNLMFYEALARIPLGAAVAIEFLGPLGVAVASSRKWQDVSLAVLAFAGVAALALTDFDGVRFAGVLFALGGAFFWAAYMVLANRTSGSFQGLEGLALGLPAAALVTLPFGLTSEPSQLLHPHVLLFGLAIALLSTAIPYSMELFAFRHLPRHVFTVLLSVEPVIATLAGALILSQHLAAHQLLGVGAIVVASVAVTLRHRQDSRQGEAPGRPPDTESLPLVD